MLDKNCVFLNLDCAVSEEVLTYMGSKLCEQGYVKESYVQAVVEREKVYATGLDTEGVKVAIPHTGAEHVNKATVAVATLKRPVAFESMEQDHSLLDVEIVFMLAISDSRKQVALLGDIMKVIQDERLLHEIKQATCTEKIVDMLADRIHLD